MSREILDTSKKAAAAINVLGGVIGLLEGGVDSGWQKAATQIINICKREQQRQLRIMDKTELFFPAGDVLIQQSAHPLWAAKLQPSFTLGLCVGAPGHRGWPGRCWGAPCPLSLTASHAA